MAKVIGQVESLKSLRDELNRRNISRFNSIGDINKFNKEYKNEKRYILNYHENRIDKEIDNILMEIILKLMQKEPAQRYQSAKGLLFDLEKVKNNQSNLVLGLKDSYATINYNAKFVGRKDELFEL